MHALLLQLDERGVLGPERLGYVRSLAFNDHLADLEGVALLEERALQRQQLVEDHTESKDIGRKAVLLVEENLRRHVAVDRKNEKRKQASKRASKQTNKQSKSFKLDEMNRI